MNCLPGGHSDKLYQVWGVDEVLSKCVLLIRAQLWQRPQCLPLVKIWLLIGCVESTDCSFFLSEDRHLKLLPYKDSPT